MKYFEILYKKHNKLLITKKELSQELGISEATLNRRLYGGEITIAYNKLGNMYLFSIKSLAEYMEALDSLVA